MLVRQAFDGAVIADLPTEGVEVLLAKLEHASQCFADRTNWLPAYKRIEILKRLAVLVQRDFDDFALGIAREGGKPLADARVEVSRAINSIEGAVSDMQHMAGVEIPMGLTPSSAGRWAFTTTEPIGVVVAISAFNHPLNLIVHQVVPAIATGCPILVKPAETTPITCLKFVSLVREAGLPEPWCQTLLPENVSLAEQIVTDPRVAFLSFIGSAKVGWYLRSRLSPGTRFALEHGGCAPVIVDRSADLDKIVEPLVKGAYYHAGQVCVSVQRIFVHQDLKPRFVDRFSRRIQSLRVGDPTQADTDVGPLILPKEVNRVEEWVREAIKSGGHVEAGGARLSDHVYQPTCILEPSAAARVSTEEVFGPVTCVYGYTDIDEAISRANSLPFAFQASVFAQDIDVAIRSARLLDAGAVMINDHTAFRTDWMPFAGRRQSGFGIGGIPYTMRDMTQEKMIVFNS